MGPAVPQLRGGKGAVLVEHVAHDGQVLDVVVVPKPCGDAMRVVRLGRDRAVLGTAGAVAALRLHRAEIRLAQWLLRPEAVAMRDLVEAVLHRLGSELDRLEEDVVLRVTRHVAKPPLADGAPPRFSIHYVCVASGNQTPERGRLAAPSLAGRCQVTDTTGASGAATSSGSCGVSSRQCGVSLSWTIRRDRKRTKEMARTEKPMIFSLVPP